jgi:hypothetical protein
MRGAFADQGGLFSYISPEARVSPAHFADGEQRFHAMVSSYFARW